MRRQALWKPSSVLGSVTGAAAWLVLVIACSSAPTVRDRLCTPGAYVYCRCANRAEGTKLCRDDAQSFDPCACGGGASTGDVVSDTNKTPFDGGTVTVDAGPVDPGAPRIADSCNDKLVVVAGSTASPDAVLAVYRGAGRFDVVKSIGAGVAGPPSLVPVGNALVATWPSRGSSPPPIAWSKYEGGSWAAASTVGSAQSKKASTAAAYKDEARLVYVAPDDTLKVGAYTQATGWNTLIAPVGPAGDAGPDDAMRSALSSAALTGNGDTIFPYVTGTKLLRVRTLSGSTKDSWLATTTANDPATFKAADLMTSVAPLDGARDAIAVFANDVDVTLWWSARTATTRDWTKPVLVDPAAAAFEHALVGIPGGNAMLVYVDANDALVSSFFDRTKFSPPKPLLETDNPAAAAVPSVAVSRCGGQLTLAYARKGSGNVEILRYSGAAWEGPFAVPGAGPATWATVGELP